MPAEDIARRTLLQAWAGCCAKPKAEKVAPLRKQALS